MFNELDKIVGEFDKVILEVITPTQKMIDTVADEWEYQFKNYDNVNLNTENCEGMTQLEIDATTKWLYKNN